MLVDTVLKADAFNCALDAKDAAETWVRGQGNDGMDIVAELGPRGFVGVVIEWNDATSFNVVGYVKADPFGFYA